MTNATKALITTAINATLGLVVLLGLLSTPVAGSVGIVVNAWIAVIVAITYKDSPKRMPDSPTRVPDAP